MITADKRYNLLFVFPDQLSAQWTGVHGEGEVSTPNLDRFATKGVRFDRSYTACPLCTPYRGTLFTGRYPLQTGVTENNFHIPTCETVLPDLLNQAGYLTSYVGKWHLSGAGRQHHRGEGFRWVAPPDRLGFQDFIGWESWHIDHWDGVIWGDDPDRPLRLAGHETDGLTQIAMERLGGLRDQQFAMFVSYQAPHPPCSPPEEYRDLYRRDRSIRRPTVDESSTIFDRAADQRIGQAEFAARYFGEVSHLDAAFRRLLDHLETLGIADRTIVVFTSDHGEMAGVHGIFGKSVMYEEALQTPLIIRHPDGASGTTCRKLVSSVDLMPTILDLLGAPIPTTCEGRSFAAQLRGDEPDAEPEHVFAHYSVSGTQGLADAGGEVCVRTASHKLVASFEDHLVGRPTQLFDLQADRYEEVNLADDEAHGDIRQELLSVLDRWVADVETRIGQPDEAARPSCTARRTLSIG